MRLCCLPGLYLRVTWTKTLTWGQTEPTPPLSTATLQKTTAEERLEKTSACQSGHVCAGSHRWSWIILFAGYTAALPSARAIFWPRFDVRDPGERQALSPAVGCGAAILAPSEQLHAGGRPEWGLMRPRPHQRLPSSLQSTCATLSVRWERGSCPTTAPLPVITPTIGRSTTFEISEVHVWVAVERVTAPCCF